jgi:hypothetical protein
LEKDWATVMDSVKEKVRDLDSDLATEKETGWAMEKDLEKD